LLLFIIVLFILKRRDIHLFSLGINLAHSYEEISNSFIKILKNIFFLILMMVILSTVVETLTLEYVSSWTRTIISDYEVIIGVFLASLLSIIVHSWLNYGRKRMEIRKNSAALFNDVKNIFNALNRAKLRLEVFCKEDKPQELLFGEIDPVIKINYNSHWRDHYSVIHEQLPFKYYEKIDTTYSSVEDFNKAVQNNDIRLLKHSIIRAVPGQVEGYTDLQKLTPKQLIDGLGRLTQNKKVKSEVYAFLFSEFLYLIKKLLVYKKIEMQMIAIIKKNKKLKDIEVEKALNEWLSLPEEKFENIICRKILARIMFEIGLKSKAIKLVWGDYQLVNEEE